MDHVFPAGGDVASTRSVRGEQDEPFAAGTQWSLWVFPEVGQRAEVGGYRTGQVRGRTAKLSGCAG